MEIKGKKQEVFNKMVEFLDKCSDEEIIYCYFSKKETKEIKTRSQEKTYYKILDAISKHLWYSLQEVKIYMLSWCFWTKTLQMSKEKMEIPIISETKLLTKEQWIFFIETLLAFVKIKNVPVEITSNEIKNLLLTYK